VALLGARQGAPAPDSCRGRAGEAAGVRWFHLLPWKKIMARRPPFVFNPFPSSGSSCGRVGAWGALAFLAALGILSATGCRMKPKHFVPEPGADFSRGMLYRVEKGDTLGALADYYERDVRLLAYLNELGPPYAIREGEYLYIPPDNSDSILRTGKLSVAKIHEVRRRMGGSGTPIAVVARSRGEERLVPGRLRSSSARRKNSPTSRKASHRDLENTDTEDTGAGPEPDSRFRLVWPVEGTYSRGFARTRVWKSHTGVDILAPEGTPIRAAQNGTVLFSGNPAAISAYRGFKTYGIMVVIDHDNGFATIYAHCSKALVRTGRRVRQNDTIAWVGSTGNATGSHVHLELRYNGEAVKPEKYFPAFRNRPLIASGNK